MIYIVVLLSITTVVSTVLLLLQKKEIANIRSSLKKIREERSSEKLHSVTGTAETDALITEINSLLEDLRSESALYRRRRHELDNMLTNISHDLRTPLTAALGYLEIVREGGLSAEEEERELAVISERLGRLRELIDSFFEFSRIVSEDKEPKKESINLVALIEDSVSGFYDVYEDSGRHIELDLKGTRFDIVSNRMMLLRIVDNLISNSYKHGSGDLHIVRDDNKLIFGNEMPEGELTDVSRVFDEFWTTDVSRTKGGTGLGLAIVKQFSEMLSIGISADAEDGSFRIVLDLAGIRA